MSELKEIQSKLDSDTFGLVLDQLQYTQIVRALENNEITLTNKQVLKLLQHPKDVAKTEISPKYVVLQTDYIRRLHNLPENIRDFIVDQNYNRIPIEPTNINRDNLFAFIKDFKQEQQIPLELLLIGGEYDLKNEYDQKNQKEIDYVLTTIKSDGQKSLIFRLYDEGSYDLFMKELMTYYLYTPKAFARFFNTDGRTYYTSLQGDIMVLEFDSESG